MLRAAADADLGAMLSWRNQEVNRLVSVTDHVIGPDEHAAWWSRTANDPSRAVLVFELDGVPCGVVSFFDLDRDARIGAWGFYLDNEGLAASGGLMSAWFAIMREATDHAFDVLGLDRLDGEVLESNEVVRRMNRRFGIVEHVDEAREVDGRRFIPITLTREERDRRARRRRKDS